KVKLISVVGEDFGEANMRILTARGIDVDGVEVVPGGKTFFWSGKYHNDMNSRDTLVTELNVLADFDPKILASYQDCEYLLLGNVTQQAQVDALRRLHSEPNVVVLDTLNLCIDVALGELKAG